MREKLVIWGAASHARVVANIIRLRGEYDIVGFLDNANPERAQTAFCGASILGGEEQLDELLQKGVKHLICAFSANRARLRLSALARAKGFLLATAIHPQTIIAPEAPIGAGTVIYPGVVVDVAASVGENVMLGTSSSVNHECTVEDGAWFAPDVHVGGWTIIGQAATLEIGAIIGGRLRIGADSVVGAGSVVLNDIPSKVLAYGAPAKVIREAR